MRIYVRYDTPCELFPKGSDGRHLTRREFIEQQMGDSVEEQPPELDIPDAGLGLWFLYTRASETIHRYHDGVCCLIPPSEWKIWLELNEHEIGFEEFECLQAMDIQYCNAVNEDLAAIRARNAEQQRQSAPQPKPSRRR